MDYEEIASLRRQSAAWALLSADHAPLILSFLGRTFVDQNSGQQAATTLADQLDEDLYALNERLGEGMFPRAAGAYLDDWASPERGWLRKFYPAGSDEAHYDLTPAVEKAVRWVRDLRSREFIGTESRLNTIFELLRQMVFGAETDAGLRLAELYRQRADLDEQIAQIQTGDVPTLDPVGQRDRYQQFARTARELLADFREVEENFRSLDRTLRQQIASWGGSKGELLDEVLGDRHSIAESDQGRSFQAFYDFLLSHQKQAELSDLLDRLHSIESIDASDDRLRHIHHDWIDAGERTQGTVRLLSEQLRRFLDDQVWLENRRVFDLLHSIESTALAIRQQRNPPVSTEMNGTAATLALPFERPLYTPQRHTPLQSAELEDGGTDFDPSVLLEQVYVDREALARTVRRSLQHRSQLDLAELLEHHPLDLGLAELVGYLSLQDSAFAVVFDHARRQFISWQSEDGDRVADLPQVSFARSQGEQSHD